MDNITRIRQLDRQIKEIKRIIREGQYWGAGLSISLAVGANPDHDDYLNLECSEMIEEILTTVCQSLEAAKEMRRIMMLADYQRLTDFISDNQF
jgi:hypothetical protein